MVVVVVVVGFVKKSTIDDPEPLELEVPEPLELEPELLELEPPELESSAPMPITVPEKI